MDLPIGPDRSADRSPALDAAPPEPVSHAERLAASVDADPIAQTQALADLTAHPENYGPFVETPKARTVLTMLAGTLPNMDPYGGINAVLNGIPRPEATREVGLADAAVPRPREAGPDVETRTLRPPGVYITGPDAEATYTSLNAYSYLDLRFDRTTGQLTADPLSPERLATLPPRDQVLLRAITNTRADIVLTTTREDRPTDRYGQPVEMVVGTYDGNMLDPAAGQYEARQIFNLRHAKVVASVTHEHAGSSVMHEVNEAFLGTEMSPGMDHSAYRPVHLITEAYDEHQRTWGLGYDFNADQVLVGVSYPDPSAPGGTRIKALYVDPTRHVRLDRSGNHVLDPQGRLIILDGPPRSLTLPPDSR